MAIESTELPAATTTAQGAVELATTAEANAGTDTTRAVVASGLLVRKTGTAIIGGDLTGDARGVNAVDIQSERSAAGQVASASNGVAIGQRNTASGYYSSVAIGYGNTAGVNGIAIGRDNTASGYKNVAIGYSCEASNSSVAAGYQNTSSGQYSLALGYSNTASNYGSSAVGYINTASGYSSSAFGHKSQATVTSASAFGYYAMARIQKTTNICGPQIIRKDNEEAAEDAFHSFCGVEVILMSKEINLETVTDQTITLPSNCKFWLNEIGCIATVVDTMTVQPTIRFGITGDLAKHNAAAITTDLTAAGKREIETPLVPKDGETSLTAGVTIAATATTMKGRFYWKGMLVEDE